MPSSDTMPRLLRVDATIGSLAPGGDGVAHVSVRGERRAVFVPRAAPGDVVRAEVDFSQRPARGRLLDVLVAGLDRVTPPCRWSTVCGGCDWMHLSSDAQARTHVDHVRSALPAAWRDRDIVHHPAPSPLAHRSRTRVHVRCDRGRVLVGMHEARSHRPVQVERCAVLDPRLESARASLPALFEGSRGVGDVLLALGAERVPVLDIAWMGELAPVCLGRLERAVGARALAGARVRLKGATRPMTVGDPTPWMLAADDLPLRLAPGGFAQANEEVNRLLARHVAELAASTGEDSAVELYAGSGNLSVLLARSLRPRTTNQTRGELVLVESNSEACEAAEWNLAARDLRARVVRADVEGHAWSPLARLVVLDPPRTGARAVTERLVSSRVAHVIYVSCDAQTLARDLARLAVAYELVSVTAFEMFPQTSHVETVVALERRRRSVPRETALEDSRRTATARGDGALRLSLCVRRLRARRSPGSSGRNRTRRGDRGSGRSLLARLSGGTSPLGATRRRSRRGTT